MIKLKRIHSERGGGEKERERERDRQTDRDRQRQRHTETETTTERETQAGCVGWGGEEVDSKVQASESAST